VNTADKTEQAAIPSKPAVLEAGRFSFPLGKRTYIMGILNVTPDSFSDGGLFLPVGQALQHVSDMLASGADIIDIGGESTRPGGVPVSAEEELDRIMPILEMVIRTFHCPVSIDTAKSGVAKTALEMGACMVNDINGLQGDPEMADMVSYHHAAVVMMHNARLYRNPSLADQPTWPLLEDMHAFLEKSCLIAKKAGIPAEQMVIDPGVGFGVSPEESIQMISSLPLLKSFHLPILLAPSRKRFIGHILGLPADQRLNGTSAAVAIGIANGADIVRVHDVRAMAEVARVADALCRSGNNQEGTV
jgi:dihydropteroate synthase